MNEQYTGKDAIDSSIAKAIHDDKGQIDNSDGPRFDLMPAQKQLGQFLTSNDQTWMTPPEFMASLKDEFDFVLDICASSKSAQAPVFYSEEDNAFTKDWALPIIGYTLANPGGARKPAYWANPPYGDKLDPEKPWQKPLSYWIGKAWMHRKTVTGVWLLPANKTDRAWWHKLVVPYAEVRDVEGRINFLDPETGKVPLKPKKDPETCEEKWVRNGNSQASKLVIFGPGAEVGKLKSHKWRKT